MRGKSSRTHFGGSLQQVTPDNLIKSRLNNYQIVLQNHCISGQLLLFLLVNNKPEILYFLFYYVICRARFYWPENKKKIDLKIQRN